MTLADGVRARISYPRFRRLASSVETGDPVEALDAFFAVLDAMRAFRSESGAAYAGEALELALEDHLREKGDIRHEEFAHRRQQRESEHPKDALQRAFLGNAQRSRREAVRAAVAAKAVG